MGLFGSSKPQDETFFKTFFTEQLHSRLMFNCITRCQEEYDDEITNDEKICMAKCIDRSNDYVDMYKDRFTKQLKDGESYEQKQDLEAFLDMSQQPILIQN